MTAAAIYLDPAVLWERITARVEILPNGCWEFTGPVNSKGYGCIGSGRKSRTVLVHRIAVIVRDGQLDAALEVDHTCHNTDPTCPGGLACRHRRCVNPEHLDPVTSLVNTRRSGHGSQTHCRRNHPLSGSNLYLHSHGDSRPPSRGCRECRAIRDAARLRAA